ncbi:Golgin candidate 1, partial [Linum perenne]
MAAWLKAAEGLFEVVDRQAKLVVNELSEEQSDSLPPASSEQGSQPKKTKPKPKSKSKAQKRLPKEESTIASEPVQELARTQPLEAELVNRSSHSVENDENASSNSIDKTRNEQQQTTDIVASSVAPPESTNEPVKHEADSDEIPVTVTDPVIPSSNSEILNNKASDVPEKDPPSPSPVKETEVVEEHKPIISVLDTRTTENDVSSKTELEKSSEDSLVSNENSAKDDEVKLESLVHQKNKHEHKTDATPGKIQEQLEEAQGLLKTANATGQSKEARLAREVESEKMIGRAEVCDGLYLLKGDHPKTNLTSSSVRSPIRSGFSASSLEDLDNKVMLWHFRFGHPSFRYLEHLFPSLFINKKSDSFNCEVC